MCLNSCLWFILIPYLKRCHLNLLLIQLQRRWHYLLSQSISLHKLLRKNLILRSLIDNRCIIQHYKLETFHLMYLLLYEIMTYIYMPFHLSSLLFLLFLHHLVLFGLLLSHCHYLTFVVLVQVDFVEVEGSAEHFVVCSLVGFGVVLFDWRVWWMILGIVFLCLIMIGLTMSVLSMSVVVLRKLLLVKMREEFLSCSFIDLVCLLIRKKMHLLCWQYWRLIELLLNLDKCWNLVAHGSFIVVLRSFSNLINVALNLINTHFLWLWHWRWVFVKIYYFHGIFPLWLSTIIDVEMVPNIASSELLPILCHKNWAQSACGRIGSSMLIWWVDIIYCQSLLH